MLSVMPSSLESDEESSERSEEDMVTRGGDIRRNKGPNRWWKVVKLDVRICDELFRLRERAMWV